MGVAICHVKRWIQQTRLVLPPSLSRPFSAYILTYCRAYLNGSCSDSRLATKWPRHKNNQHKLHWPVGDGMVWVGVGVGGSYWGWETITIKIIKQNNDWNIYGWRCRRRPHWKQNNNKKKLKIVMRPNGKQKTKKKGSNNWRNNNSRATHGEMFVSHHLPLCGAYPPPRHALNVQLRLERVSKSTAPPNANRTKAKCCAGNWNRHTHQYTCRQKGRERGSDTQLSTPTQLHIRIVGYNTQPSQRSPIIIIPCQSWPSFEISPSFRLIHISGLFVLACYTSHTQFISTNFVECFSRVCHASFEWEWQNLRICLRISWYWQNCV